MRLSWAATNLSVVRPGDSGSQINGSNGQRQLRTFGVARSRTLASAARCSCHCTHATTHGESTRMSVAKHAAACIPRASPDVGGRARSMSEIESAYSKQTGLTSLPVSTRRACGSYRAGRGPVRSCPRCRHCCRHHRHRLYAKNSLIKAPRDDTGWQIEAHRRRACRPPPPLHARQHIRDHTRTRRVSSGSASREERSEERRREGSLLPPLPPLPPRLESESHTTRPGEQQRVAGNEGTGHRSTFALLLELGLLLLVRALLCEDNARSRGVSYWYWRRRRQRTRSEPVYELWLLAYRDLCKPRSETAVRHTGNVARIVPFLLGQHREELLGDGCREANSKASACQPRRQRLGLLLGVLSPE